MVTEGAFSQDLYYRISTFPIELPPLRERGEDVELLSTAMLKRVGGDRPRRLSAAALEALNHYDFPGNIRELRNLLERASLLADGEIILPEHLPEECRLRGAGATAAAISFGADIQPLEEMERRYLRWAVTRYKGDKRSLATLLGLSERTFYRKLKALDD